MRTYDINDYAVDLLTSEDSLVVTLRNEKAQSSKSRVFHDLSVVEYCKEFRVMKIRFRIDIHHSVVVVISDLTRNEEGFAWSKVEKRISTR